MLVLQTFKKPVPHSSKRSDLSVHLCVLIPPVCNRTNENKFPVFSFHNLAPTRLKKYKVGKDAIVLNPFKKSAKLKSHKWAAEDEHTLVKE